MAQDATPDQTRGYFAKHKISSKRAREVLTLISEGSTPHGIYYGLISASAMIASLGLLLNSAAVVIGAMLVSPLMTPIFGMALGMVRNNTSLLLRALRAELTGMALAVLLGFALGMIPNLAQPTPELLARIQPNLLDLMVAIFAGLAGTLAVIDERVSPILPGVAISTAIIPPLAACGICLATGAMNGAKGAILLFVANLVAILLVSSLIFIRSGMAANPWLQSRRWWLPRISGAGVLFIAVTIILTHSLIKVTSSRNELEVIQKVLEQSEHKYPTFRLIDVKRRTSEGELHVLATVQTPRTFSPERVEQFQETMSKALSLPVCLTIRCALAQDISAHGLSNARLGYDLNGLNPNQQISKELSKLQFAEAMLREVLTKHPAAYIQDTQVLQDRGRTVILVTIIATWPIGSDEIADMENYARKELGDPDFYLVLRCLSPIDMTARERLLTRIEFGNPDPEQQKLIDGISQGLRKSELFLLNAEITSKNEHWDVLAEIRGNRIIKPSEVASIEREVSAVMDKPVKLKAWCRSELLVTDSEEMVMELSVHSLLDAKKIRPKAGEVLQKKDKKQQ